MAKAKTNCKVNGKDYFQMRRTVTFIHADGREEKKQKKVYGTSQSNAKEKLDTWEAAWIKEKTLEDMAPIEEKKEQDRKTFQERADEYVSEDLEVSSKYAKGTIEAYKGVYTKYIRESALASMRLIDVDAKAVQRFYNSLDVSQQRLKAINKFMVAFCKWSCLHEHSSDFIAAVNMPKKKENTRHDEIIVWTEEEIEQILSAMSLQPRHRQYFLIHLLLYTGMRISEALALKYGDIRDGVIHVDRQYYLGEEKPPKWNSKRIIPLHKNLEEPLRIHREVYENEMEKNGYRTDYVFTTSTGQLYHQASVRKALNRFYASKGITQKHIHAYRATFCTQLCRCGVPLEVAAKLMGHKSIEVTVAHYALVRKDTLEDAIRLLSY